MESILYGGNYFFGRHLSIFHQTVYFAMYLCTGIAILLFNKHLFSSRLRVVLLSVFIFFIFLVSNKASFIVLTLILGIKVWTWNAHRGKKLIGLSAFILILLAFVLFNPRVKMGVVNLAKGKAVVNKEARYGLATRLLSWDAAIALIKEKPMFGYGYAETQVALNKKYQEKGYIYPLKDSYNAHNLWLQSWLENGFLAVLLLFSLFYILLRQELGNFKSAPLLLTFVFILLINSMFEGLFNRFSGISFFSFLVCFIFSASKGGLVKK
ncbi:O-antigen ligase family protein [Maribacter sp. 2308TA10-17]|uniref:O-antigen ligase family protein n=1 Tax=Maribacter sp. 2308TA10-17 TaxID=3386276 RepID=UPI0039BCBEC3